jgi:hypothetical protein
VSELTAAGQGATAASVKMLPGQLGGLTVLDDFLAQAVITTEGTR